MKSKCDARLKVYSYEMLFVACIFLFSCSHQPHVSGFTFPSFLAPKTATLPDSAAFPTLSTDFNILKTSTGSSSTTSPDSIAASSSSRGPSTLSQWNLLLENAQNNILRAVPPNIPVPGLRKFRLLQYQKEGIAIASAFKPSQYNPHPFLRNKHLQTILGVFLRDSPGVSYIQKSNWLNELFPVGKALVEALPDILGFGDDSRESSCDYWDERERFRTPDGDFFDVDYKFCSGKAPSKEGKENQVGMGMGRGMEGEGKGLVVIIHGLESNSNSTVSQHMARAFIDKKFDVACVNFRGCSGCPNDTLLQYHAGFTNDLMVFLDSWAERNNNRGKQDKRPLYVTGFSLGSNIGMKLLGDLGMDAVDKYNIRGAAFSAAPFSLNFHWRQLEEDVFNRVVYAGTLLKSMKRKVEFITERYLDGNKDTDKFSYWKAINATTIGEIEDAMIAPLYGFKDRFDYYDKSASYDVVDQIAVPTFALNAADDPFFNQNIFPWEKDCSRGGTSPLKLMRTDHGGHLGHLFHVTEDDRTGAVASFSQMELGRFIEHIHDSSTVRR